MSKAPKSLSSLLQSGLQSGLVGESLKQAALKKRIQETLPGALQDHLTGCALRHGVLLLEWSSAAAANLGRFHSPRLMAILRGSAFPELKEIRMRTHPNAPSLTSRPKPRNPPAETVIHHLGSLTTHMAPDGLRDSLVRLTETLKNKRRRP